MIGPFSFLLQMLVTSAVLAWSGWQGYADPSSYLPVRVGYRVVNGLAASWLFIIYWVATDSPKGGI